MFSLATVVTAALGDISPRVLPHLEFLAQTRPAGVPAPWYVEMTKFPFPLILLVIVFYVFLFNTKRKQDRQKKEGIGNLKRGDRVQTIGGILGKVVEAEPEKVLLKVDESSNTKIWFARTAIARVLGDEKSEAK